MARYIDADRLSFYFNALAEHAEMEGLLNMAHIHRRCLQMIEDEPTADVVPKSEVENIFAEIETCMKDFEDDDDGYLLKKCEFEFFMREIKEKYAGQKNG